MSDAIFFSSTMNGLAASIDIRNKNHALLTSNIANADTPGYRPKRVDFGRALDAARAGGGLTITSSGHIQPRQASGNMPLREFNPLVPGGDGNGVELEREMAQLAENQIAYDAGIALLGKKFQGLVSAIREGK